MDMRAWLDQLGLAQFAEAFAANDIDLAVLPHLTEQDLKDLGLTIGQRRKLLVAIRALADDADPVEPATEPADRAVKSSVRLRSPIIPD